MSSDSIAAFRRKNREDLSNLANVHFQHDLYESDRDKLKSAATIISTWTFTGSLAGIALGAFLAHRVRLNRKALYRAFRATEKPSKLLFADGRQVDVPDLTPMLKPTTMGDIAAYTFFSAGGLFLIGELALLGGTWSAQQKISSDPESRERIETAFRNFRADILKKQLTELESGKKESIWE